MKEKQFDEENNRHQNDDIDVNTDDNVAGTTGLNEPVTEESELEKLRTALADSEDKYLRLVAEFENYRKRTQRERMELIMTAGKEVISSLLEILDDCDRAQRQLENSTNIEIEEIKAGVLLVFNKLRKTLYAKGLKPMECLYQEFNPDLHEAITEVPAPSPDLKGKVIDEVQKGYYLNDKIIRFAKVVVGK